MLNLFNFGFNGGSQLCVRVLELHDEFVDIIICSSLITDLFLRIINFKLFLQLLF